MNKTLTKLALASLLVAACGGEKKETETAASEKKRENANTQRNSGGYVANKNENAPKPPSDDEVKAKQAAADDKAKKASANERADFQKLVDTYEEAKKKPPGIPADDCSWARKFTSSFGGGAFAAQAHFNAGTILEGCGKVKDAEGEYNEALKANPGYGPALTNLGSLYLKQGNVQTAKQWFDKVIKSKASEQTAAAYNNLALIDYNQARDSGDTSLYKEAVSKLRRALAIDSSSVAAYGLLAQIYYQTAESDRSKLDLAALVCKQGKETDDKYAPIYNTLGLINLKKKNVTGALKEFEKAVELDPKFVEAHLNIGAIAISSRQYDKAAKSFQAVLALQPGNFDATVGMGVAQRGLKQFDDAEKWYRKATELNSKNCTISYNLGLLYQDYKLTEDNSNLKKAQELFRTFSGCGTADKKRVEDAQRRIKDIDDTFAAIEEQKKMEAESKKMQEESERMQKQMEEQQKQQEQQAAPKK
jgi:tetratricopeptide (TPR) repeat protein